MLHHQNRYASVGASIARPNNLRLWNRCEDSCCGARCAPCRQSGFVSHRPFGVPDTFLANKWLRQLSTPAHACPLAASATGSARARGRCHSLRSLDSATGGAPIAPPYGCIFILFVRLRMTTFVGAAYFYLRLRRGEHCVKCNMVYTSARTWYTTYNLAMVRWIRCPSSASNSAILKFR